MPKGTKPDYIPGETETLPEVLPPSAARERHLSFARLWFNGDASKGIEPFNGVKAYMAIYAPAEAGKTITPEAAATNASRLLNTEHVRGELEALKRTAHAIAGLDAGRIRQEIAYLAHSDITELLDENGLIDPKVLKSLPEHVRHAIADYELVEIPTRHGEPIRKLRLKLHKKTSALDLAAKVEKLTGSGAQVNNGIVINIIGDD